MDSRADRRGVLRLHKLSCPSAWRRIRVSSSSRWL